MKMQIVQVGVGESFTKAEKIEPMERGKGGI